MLEILFFHNRARWRLARLLDSYTFPRQGVIKTRFFHVKAQGDCVAFTMEVINLSDDVSFQEIARVYYRIAESASLMHGH